MQDSVQAPGDRERVERFVAVLFTSGDPIPADQLADLLEVDAADLPGLAERAGERLAATPLVVRAVAHGWQLVLSGPAAAWVGRATGRRAPDRLSAAAWEVLAVVAYRQPVTRLEIEALRGVSSDHAVDTLVSRGLVGEVGRKEVPGRPILYATTERFLEVFGLNSLSALPPAPDPAEASRDEATGGREG